MPTFRPDAVVHVATPAGATDVAALARLADVDTDDYNGFLDALRQRRRAFVDAGALATDHGHATADTTPLPEAEAARSTGGARRRSRPARPRLSPRTCCIDGRDVLRRRPRDAAPPRRPAGPPQRSRRRLRRRQGLRHPGAGRVHPAPAAAAGGVRARPAFRTDPLHHRRDHYSRELAPLAGAYPSVRLGAPWWFLDSPDGMRRFRERPPRRPASTTPPASSTTPAPSPRSRPGTTCPAGSTRATSPAWSPSTGSTRTRPSRPRSTSPTPCRSWPTSAGADPLRAARRPGPRGPGVS